MSYLDWIDEDGERDPEDEPLTEEEEHEMLEELNERYPDWGWPEAGAR